MIDAEQKQQLRHTVLGYLTTSAPNARTRKQVLIHAAMEVDFELALSDVVQALEFLKGMQYAASIEDELGISTYWSATSAGVLAVERDQRPGRPRHD